MTLIDPTLELPSDLRDEVKAMAAKTKTPVAWFVALYRRGFAAKLGATGEFPYGKLSAPTGASEDEGELAMALAADPQHGIIRLVFGKPVAWLALPPMQARHLATLLMEKADQVERKLS
jgi:hypothetical protein